MIDYIYGVESFSDKGRTKYTVVKEKVLKETQLLYFLEHYGGSHVNFKKRVKKTNAFLTPEAAIKAYRDRLIEGLSTNEANIMDLEVKLATFECTFNAQLEDVLSNQEELDHAQQHKLLYDHFEELVKDWYDREEHAEQRGTVLDLEAWACKQAGGLDHKRH